MGRSPRPLNYDRILHVAAAPSYSSPTWHPRWSNIKKLYAEQCVYGRSTAQPAPLFCCSFVSSLANILQLPHKILLPKNVLVHLTSGARNRGQDKYKQKGERCDVWVEVWALGGGCVFLFLSVIISLLAAGLRNGQAKMITSQECKVKLLRFYCLN